jgi:hypothetical protein
MIGFGRLTLARDDGGDGERAVGHAGVVSRNADGACRGGSEGLDGRGVGQRREEGGEHEGEHGGESSASASASS